MAGAARATFAQTGLEYLAVLGLSTTGITAEALSMAVWRIAMHVTTVATVKRATAMGLTPAAAAALGSRRSLGSAKRHVIDAQRSVVMQTSKWQRVSVGLADCDFCKMLIGRGAVYSRSTADFKSHDNCDCLAEPELS